ncbi:hypothetical protein ASE48_10115 [Mycobacterium sp. Root265]|uniref:hypothetical protein n=1 Tax=Mycobacterium sp. Root265 TaxID=1736504 RepID=UPI00071023AE|nr:hypothetical protein [Mycobacterium sp. Root265]KRD07782.1 hypothetical protein ASE48_10115 [Mycobacterium sp. Root265]
MLSSLLNLEISDVVPPDATKKTGARPVWERLALGYRILYAFAGFALLVLNVLIEKKVVDWDPMVAVWAACGVGLVALFDNVRLIKFKYDARERNAARARLYRPMFSALVALSDIREGIHVFDLGVSVFKISRVWFLWCGVIPWSEKRLVRIVRLRLSDSPNESNVRWTKGKGAIGVCWQSNVAVHHDRRADAATWGKNGQYPSEAQFADLQDDQKRGMNREEFIQTIDKYGEILAVPMVTPHKGEQLGVLSVDCLATAYAGPDSQSILQGEDIEAIAVRTARLTRDDVGKF